MQGIKTHPQYKPVSFSCKESTSKDDSMPDNSFLISAQEKKNARKDIKQKSIIQVKTFELKSN